MTGITSRPQASNGQNSQTVSLGVQQTSRAAPEPFTSPYAPRPPPDPIDYYAPDYDPPFTVAWTLRCAVLPDRLTKLSKDVPASHALQYAPVLDRVRREGDLTSPTRVALWISQIVEETKYMKTLVEDLTYTKAASLVKLFPSNVPTLAYATEIVAKAKSNPGGYDQEYVGNIIYADRNGNHLPGDGYKYRGRGFLQLTGRANYRALAAVTGLDLEANPDQAADPPTAALIAAVYWRSRNCNTYADKKDVKSVTRLINGAGYAGLDTRVALSTKALTIWK